MTYPWQLPDWPNYRYDKMAVSNLLYRYAIENGQLAESIASLPSPLNQEATIDLMVSEAIETMAIEGEHLDRPSVISSIKAQLGLKQPPNQTSDPKARRIASLMLAIREQFQKPIDKPTLITWENTLFQDKWWQSTDLSQHPWRTEEMVIVKGGKMENQNTVVFEAVPLDRVDLEMGRFLDWYNSNSPQRGSGVDQAMPGPVRAAIAHLWFETIHPFNDGNGRIGRAIAEHALAQDVQRPPLASLSSAIQVRKTEYYNALEQTNESMEITPWIQYFIKTAIQAQLIAKQQIERVLTKARFFERHQDQLSERQQEVIAHMFDVEPGIRERSINRNKYVSIVHTSPKTAQRDIKDLLDKGALVPLPGGGRSTRYALDLNGLTQAITRADIALMATQFPANTQITAALEYLPYRGEIVKQSDRFIVQRKAKNHLIMHRRSQLDGEIHDQQINNIDYLAGLDHKAVVSAVTEQP